MSGAFENNIIVNLSGSGTGGMFFKSETALNAWTTDYNVWAPAATGMFNFKGNAYDSLPAYQAGESRDAHSTNTAPAFANPSYVLPARPTFTDFAAAFQAFVAGQSPARAAGVVLVGPDSPYGF
jgi:hypothetical protein